MPVVDAYGSGDYRSISDAVRSAQPNTRVLVRPGVYREGVVIDKPLEIIGDGPIDQIRIENSASDCINIFVRFGNVGNVVLRGLTLVQFKARYGDTPVKLWGGKLVLEDCHISSDSWSCIQISGSKNTTIRRCKVHGMYYNGIFAQESRITVEACDIFGAEKGVDIDNDHGYGSVVHHCKIHDTREHGITFSRARVTVEDCEIFDFAGESGIWIGYKANAVIRRCKVRHGTAKGGIIVAGRGWVEDCQIFGNSGHGVVFLEGEGQRAELWRCRINNNGKYGVSAGPGAKGTVKECHLTSNRLGAWDIWPGASVRHYDKDY